MRLCAAVVLAGCSFQGKAGSNPGGGDAPVSIDAPRIDAPRVIDARPDAPPDAFVFLDAPAHPPNWWNASWGSRMQLTISNGATTAMPLGYQVGLALDLDAAPCTGSRDQVRIVYNNTTDLPRVIDEVGTTEWTWFPLQAAIAAGTTNTNYWLYCQNATPTTALADPTMVFDVWDDFAGNALGAAWASQGAVSVANGVVTIGANGGIHSVDNFGPHVAMDTMATASTASVSNPGWWLGFEVTFNITAPWVVWYASSANAIHPSVNESGTPHNDATVPLDTNPHLYGVEHYGDASAFRLADVITDNHTNASTITTPLNLRLSVLQGGGTVAFDWVRVRKAVSPAPTVTVGTVETY